jgi:hypothetical protein
MAWQNIIVDSQNLKHFENETERQGEFLANLNIACGLNI